MSDQKVVLSQEQINKIGREKIMKYTRRMVPHDVDLTMSVGEMVKQLSGECSYHPLRDSLNYYEVKFEKWAKPELPALEYKVLYPDSHVESLFPSFNPPIGATYNYIVGARITDAYLVTVVVKTHPESVLLNV
jgi:hypothetical protein